MVRIAGICFCLLVIACSQVQTNVTELLHLPIAMDDAKHALEKRGYIMGDPRDNYWAIGEFLGRRSCVVLFPDSNEKVSSYRISWFSEDTNSLRLHFSTLADLLPKDRGEPDSVNAESDGLWIGESLVWNSQEKVTILTYARSLEKSRGFTSLFHSIEKGEPWKKEPSPEFLEPPSPPDPKK